jgi:hypothetical protein
MVQLEIIGVLTKEEIKDVFKELFLGGTVEKEFKSHDGTMKRKVIVSNKKLYLGNNQSLRLSQDKETNLYFLTLDYFSNSDRKKVNELKKGNAKDVETFDF